MITRALTIFYVIMQLPSVSNWSARAQLKIFAGTFSMFDRRRRDFNICIKGDQLISFHLP